MKLQLTPVQIAQFAAQISAIPGDLTATQEAALQAAKLLDSEGFSPWTWRDVAAIIENVGHQTHGIRGWGALVEPIAQKTDRKGYYVLGSESGTGIEVMAKPKKTAQPQGLSWSPTLAPSEMEGFYAEDPGLRRIALSGSKCFGNWEQGNRECGACPLARFCAEAQVAKMATLARILDQQTEEAMKKPLPAPLPVETPAPVESTPEPPAPIEEIPSISSTVNIDTALASLAAKGLNVRKMTSPFAAVCSGCRGNIPSGVEIIWVQGRGLFEASCAGNI